LKTLRLILGDQLNSQHNWYKKVDNDVVYCLFEMRQETDYVKHHIQKIAGFFAAMRQFADELKSLGHQVVYFRINDAQNTQSLTRNLETLITQKGILNFEYQLPDEYRLDEQLKTFCTSLPISHTVYDTEHFLSTREDIAQLFAGKKQVLMETFYREMRLRYGIMMEGKKPVGGKWNYDSENRNKWKGNPPSPKHNLIENDVSQIVEEIQDSCAEYFGNINALKFSWPISRNQGLKLLEYFVKESLPFFGQFQDAMTEKEAYLFHSRLSFALNIKLISPLEVVQRAIQECNHIRQRLVFHKLKVLLGK
jgi:deoxyribodipyrimidine photolyase-related protein